MSTYPYWQPQQQPTPPPPPRRKRHTVRNATLGILGTIVVAGVATAVLTAPHSGSEATQPQHTSTQQAAPPPAPPPAPSPVATTPQYTAGQEAAIQDADNYLSNEPGFSESGLISQLEYDQFSAADAEFAVNHITVNWDEQAADDAQNYQQNEGGFSCDGLISQLEFDGFTSSQAEYGADQAGLCS